MAPLVTNLEHVYRSLTLPFYAIITSDGWLTAVTSDDGWMEAKGHGNKGINSLLFEV
jgi:hypothetical protein